jgi:predicted RNA-binding Zn ribbon-like protein
MVDASNLPLVAGHRALDLVNTVEPRVAAGRQPERDHLTGPEALLVWARRAGLADEVELAEVARAWERDPGAARAALAAVTEIRESLYAALAGAMGLAPADAAETGAALERLHSRWYAAVGRSTLRLEPTHPDGSSGARGPGAAGAGDAALAREFAGRPRAEAADANAGLTSGRAAPRLFVGMAPALLLPDRAAVAAYDLLFTADLDRLGRCPTEEGGCGWLFLDHSRNRSRRWCRMADCGAEVKARRLTERRRAARTPSA